jgi:hypothetical protein
MMPNQATADSRAVDLKPVRWNQVQHTDSAVTVHYTASGSRGCQILGRLDVVETETTITVTVLLGHLPDVDCGGPQKLLAADFVATATLGQPVGTRSIQDGAPA